jgi:4-amino-4-deoxy-L-arabinose transferase-like glycosyltransferase
MKIPQGIILFTLFGLPWYFAMYSLHGSAFIDTFIGFHNITRFTSPEHPEGVLWYYYIPVLLLGFFPWTALMVQAIWKSIKERYQGNSAMLFLHIWAAFIFVFFSISQTKLVSYILPMYPPLAIIVGCYLEGILHRQNSRSRQFGWGITLAVLTSILAGGFFMGLKEAPEISTGVAAIGAVWGLMALGVLLCIWRRSVMAAVWTKVIGMAVFSVILVTLIFPVLAPKFSSIAIAREFARQYDKTSPVYIIKFLHPGFTFYSGVYGKELKTEKELEAALEKEEKAYYILRSMDYKLLDEKERQGLSILASDADKLLLQKK